MADALDLLDDLFDEIQPLQKKEKDAAAAAAAAKFKPKNLKNLPKPSIPKLQKPSLPTDTLHQSQDADISLGAHLDNSLSPYSATDQCEGTAHPKTKLQPQRRKQPASPGSDGPSDINRTEMPNHETEGFLSPEVDFSNKSDFEAPTSLSEIDLLDDVSLEPLFSSAEPTIELQPKENEKEGQGRKMNFSVPEGYGSESPDRLINQGFFTYEEIQANDASESGVEEHTQNDEEGQNYGSTGEKEKEDAPNLDDVFNFLDDTDPIIDMDEANEDHADKDYTGEEEDKGRPEKEMPVDAGKPSKRKNRRSTDADANVEEGSPKKKEKLPHRIRRKRRKVDPVLLETPENEINPKQISIRNLILLAEAKEKKWNKEAASRNANGDASSMPRRREQEEFEFFDFEGHEEEHSRQVPAPQETFEPTIKKLNYGTYMNRSSSRWTQSETELFYKGIRQFGTDFAMIQQLFPNRTRHQIKLKFKSEDKKHPTRVRDAITHRLTDNSQFEKVIEILEIQADKVAPEESEPSYQNKVDHWKNEEEIDEAEENFETSHNDFDNSGKQDSVPGDDLDAVFNWDNDEMENEELVF